MGSGQLLLEHGDGWQRARHNLIATASGSRGCGPAVPLAAGPSSQGTFRHVGNMAQGAASEKVVMSLA